MQQALSDQQYSIADTSDVSFSLQVPQSTTIKESVFNSRYSDSIRETGGQYSSDLTLIKGQGKNHHKSINKSDQIGNILFVSKDDELFLIDIKITSACLSSTKLHNELKEGSVLSKPLLFPYCVERGQVSADLIKTHIELLEKLGIIFHKSNEWQLRQIPNVISISDPDNFITELLNTLQQNKHDLKANLIKVLAAYSNAMPDTEMVLDQLSQLNESDQKKCVRKLSEQDLQNLITDQE